MYLDDGIRALVELPRAPKEKLRHSMYNVAAFSPTAQQIGESIARVIGEVDFTFVPDPMRQGILDSWPDVLDDACARQDWGWKSNYDLDAMTADIIPRIRKILEHGDTFTPTHL